ncbi:MAG: hypothetical protein KGR26_07805, partial [Cyanobacteria bacterium REEB65]|nr:hypothetical protein [Cyanobacteria bacterium REEB65]
MSGATEDAGSDGSPAPQPQGAQPTTHEGEKLPSRIFDAITRTSVDLAARATGLVLTGWLVLAIVAVLFASRLSATISNTFDPPGGTQSAQVQQILAARFPELTTPYLLEVLHDSDPAQLQKYRARLAATLASDPRLAEILTPAQLGVDRQLS